MNIKIIIYALLLASCVSGYNDKEKVLFEKIKPGMTREQVVSILGIPDDSGCNDVNHSCQEFIYFSTDKYWSELPTVIFDSTGRVKYSFYYRNDIRE